MEGQHGEINAYVVSAAEPKSAVQTQYRIKPLSLHERVPSLVEPRYGDGGEPRCWQLTVVVQ